jgi:photosystem II stability/assembly factor-like uncharacterized protein
LYGLDFVDSLRGFAVGAKGIILRTDDGGATWKDLESGIDTTIFSVSAASRLDALVAGDQGRVLRTKDGGESWELQPTITTASLFSVAYHGGDDAWVAGRGGAILRRHGDVATVKIPKPRLPPALKGPPKLTNVETRIVTDDGDIPKALPKTKTP